MRQLTLAEYQEAERDVALEEGRRGLTVHSVITILVAIGLIVLNITVATEFPWSIFPVLGMTIGLTAHWYFGIRLGDETMRHHQEDIEHLAAA